MNYIFAETLPNGLHADPVLISGTDSAALNGKEYVIILNDSDNSIEHIFEIRYAYSCGPFKQVIRLENIIAVGHQDNCYLFDVSENKNIQTLKFNGYFDDLHVHEHNFYVAHASGIYCLDIHGHIKWQNHNLAIDGIIIDTFDTDVIIGSGQWDPPDGWGDFVLDKKTGVLLSME